VPQTNHCVWRYTQATNSGAKLTFTSVRPAGSPGMSKPTSVAIDSAGNLYITVRTHPQGGCVLVQRERESPPPPPPVPPPPPACRIKGVSPALPSAPSRAPL
jgi:hypothetical protein